VVALVGHLVREKGKEGSEGREVSEGDERGLLRYLKLQY